MQEIREVVITPGGDEKQYWRDLWRYRELFVFLAWRDILVRYKQTALGPAWSLIRPLLTVSAFTLVFGFLARFPSDGVPYPLFVFAAMLPWQFFASSLVEIGGSLQNNAHILSKVYFPRLIVPAGAMVVGLADFLVAFLIFILMAVAMGHPLPVVRLPLLPVLLLVVLASAFGLGLWVSAVSVRIRDFRHLVPFVTQIGLYVSPVGFGSGIVPPAWRVLYDLNPMVGVIDGFRWTLLGGASPFPGRGLAWAALCSAVLLLTGLRRFRRVERTMADVL